MQCLPCQSQLQLARFEEGRLSASQPGRRSGPRLLGLARSIWAPQSVTLAHTSLQCLRAGDFDLHGQSCGEQQKPPEVEVPPG